MKKAKFLFVGLGSIGQRHLKNLSLIAREDRIDLEIDALRHTDSLLPAEYAELLRVIHTDISKLSVYDAIFICNPSQAHMETLAQLITRSDNFFIEKPLSIIPLTEPELARFPDSKNYYVACPLRHTKIFKYLKEYAASHSIYAARAICSSYLPEWRPGVDYRWLYCATPENGGVKLDLIHEFDYITDIFGFPEESAIFEGKFSHLEIDACDVTSALFQYPDKMVEIHLDYFGRFPLRNIQLFTSDELVTFDLLTSSIHFSGSGETIVLQEEYNDKYIQEMRLFLDIIFNHANNINSMYNANTLLNFMYGGSSQHGSRK